ncbi:MAG: hypothetical protein ABSC94_20205 [Polyangiaceae bacterium]|jgi:hypothetical protein
MRSERTNTTKRPNQSPFVHKLPATFSAGEVVESAKAGSGKTTRMKKPAANAVASTAPATRAAGAPVTPTKAEDLLKAIAAEVGLGRAIELLQGERLRVLAVIGG